MSLASWRPRVYAVVAAIIVGVLGAVDFENRLVDGDLAVPASLPHALAAALPQGAAPLTSVRARAQRDLRHGDITAAAALIPSDDRDIDVDLRARVAEQRGDILGATSAFARVGDATRAEAAIATLAAEHHLAAATAAQELLVRHYDGGGILVPEAAADAWWRLGVLRSTVAWENQGSARMMQRQAALHAYRRALALSPNEQTYLLSVAEGELEVGEPAAARAAYARTLEVGPESADAALGLVRAYAVEGNCAAARASLPRAQTTAATSGRAWPDAIDHPASPWDAAVHRCGI